jgi:hypothetical protein
MEVARPGPLVDSRYGREIGWEETELHVALRTRAREAVESARGIVAASQELRALSDSLRETGMMSLCAWCGRYRLGERWATAHTICDDCVAALQEDSLSA